MEPIHEQKDLPRFSKDFIGISHALEVKKRERRKVEQQERSLANRVLFLEKEQMRAERSLLKKKMELSRIMGIAERQAQEKEAREWSLRQRQRQIDEMRQQNRLRKLLHKQNQQYTAHVIREQNNLDYKIAKKMLEEGEKRKRFEKLEDLTTRQERYMTLNVKKQQGRSRIDQYFKNKNKEHTKVYKQKITKEEGSTLKKLSTIKKLGEIEGALRKKLQESTMRVSQMEQIIGKVSVTVRKRSQSSFNNSPDLSPMLITSMEGDLLADKYSEVEENIDFTGEGGVSEGGKVRRKRKNKHANRYKQYQLF